MNLSMQVGQKERERKKMTNRKQANKQKEQQIAFFL